jgi:hypothetical protein
VRPAIGRAFAVDEYEPGNDRRVVLSHGVWTRRFGGDAAIVGKQIQLNGEPYIVSGVAPPNFEFPVASDIWAPLTFSPDRAAERDRRTLTVIGKIGVTVSPADARAEMDVIGRRLQQQYPVSNRDRRVAVDGLSAAFREGITAPLVGILQTGAGLVLLVACANLVGLLLARATDRQRELGRSLSSD